MKFAKIALYTLAFVASHLTILHSSVLAQDIKANPVAGRSKNALCIGCHGIEGYRVAFPALYTVPMIAGQNSKYIENALKAYKNGERTHPTMRSIAASLTEQDMADLAAYYASFKKHTALIPAQFDESDHTVAVNNALNALKNNNCAACHGADYAQSIDGSIPSLAGQHADYLIQALRQYQAGDHKKALLARKHPSMTATAKQLNRSQIEAIAAYLSKLPNSHLSIPEAKKGISPQ